MTPEEVSLRDYLDTRIKSLEIQLENLSRFETQHFQLNELAFKKTEDSFKLCLDVMEVRVKKLEMASAFSSGKMWMVMAFFASIPTILAVIALVTR